MRRALLVLSLHAVLSAGVLYAQDQDFSKVEIKVTKVAGTVSMLQGAGGNIGVSVGEDGIVMVDTEFAPLAAKIKAALLGLSTRPVRFIFNTHWHFDHTDGNEIFQEMAPIVAPEPLRKRMATGGTISIAGRVIKPAPEGALPILTYTDSVTVHMNGEDIVATHYPSAHTDGDAVVYFKQSKVVQMGDLFVTYGFPFVDLDNGGSVRGMIAVLRKIVEKMPPDVKVIPGHGDVSTLEDVRKLAQMMEETQQIVAEGVRKGKSLDRLKQEKVLQAYDKYSGAFVKTDTWTEILFNDLKAAGK
jgi:glyoxylase-like metal-dependent hydrolase (beta-lactamase superfamily II)